MANLGTEQNPLLVAIVGSGPSGFYAAEALIKSEFEVNVDIIERLPSPYGLVRSGVAPDHPKLKTAINLYKKIADDPHFNLIANVTVGRDISIEDLRKTHHAVILTYGAETDRKLGIPGEELKGSHTATEFVGWYNGHPDYRELEFDLSQDVAVIIGQGNVAADVSRILSKTIDELKHTDIAQHALDALAESKLKEIHVIGRRGPAQAKFTPKELIDEGVSGEALRLVYLSTHYRKPLDWTEQKVMANQKTYNKWQQLVANSKVGIVSGNVLNAIADDLNTPLAIAEMHKLAKSGNIKDLKASGIFLGLFGNSSNQKSKLTISQDSQQLIEFLFKQRMDARKRKDYARADELRDGFIQAGLIINDTKDGIVWELSDDFDIKKLEDLQ